MINHVIAILDLIMQVWDPLSHTQTLSLRKCILQLSEDFPTLSLKNHSYQTLWQSVLDKSRSILEKDIFIPIFSSE